MLIVLELAGPQGAAGCMTTCHPEDGDLGASFLRCTWREVSRKKQRLRFLGQAHLSPAGRKVLSREQAFQLGRKGRPGSRIPV